MKKRNLSNIEKIRLSQNLLEKNLDQSLDLKKIAQASFLSTYHFHRMFHSLVGMTPRAYFEKLKLERSAFLLTVTNLSIADIAWELSYENPESYARSFKKMFQMTPSQFRKQNSRIEKEEISNSDNKFIRKNSNNSLSVKFKPKILSKKIAMYYRYVGPWEKSHKIWRKLIDSCLQIGVFHQHSELFGIWYDDPMLVGKENQRYDLGIFLTEAKFDKNLLREKFGFQFTNLNGNYISYSYSGDFSNLEIAYLEFYKWLAENSKLKIANKPCIEIYKKFPPFYSQKDSEVDILIPIQSQD